MRRRVERASMLLTAALVVFFCAAGAASARPLAQIVSPAPDALVTGHRLVVRIRVEPGLEHLRLQVGGRDLALHRPRAGDKALSASVPLTGLPRGLTTLTLTARSHDRQISLSRPLLLGRHSPGLLNEVDLPRRASGATRMHVRLGGPVSDFVVRVNGRRAKLLHRPAVPIPRNAASWLRRHGDLRRAARPTTTIPLSADDGLRAGRNRVVVLAFNAETGRWARVERTVRLSNRVPLVAAGRDRHVFTGGALRLDGRNSRPARPHERLRYRWRIIAQPAIPAAKAPARLLDSHAVRPRLVMHRPGTYKVGLRLLGGPGIPGKANATAAASASAIPGGPAEEEGQPEEMAREDVTTVEAEQSIPPYGVRITTNQPAANGATRTTIEGVTLSNEEDSVETPSGEITAVTMNRSTLTPPTLDHFSCTGSTPAPSQLLEHLVEQVGSGEIAVFTGNGCLAPAGAPGPSSIYASDFTVIAEANEAVAYNAGRELGFGPGAVRGLLRKVVAGGAQLYSFSFNQAVEFDTRFEKAQNGQIELGTRIVEPPGEEPKPIFYSSNAGNWPENREVSGISIRSLNPALETMSGLSENVNVQGANVGSETGALEKVRNLLAKIAAEDQYGVLLLQTYGEPRPNGSNLTAWEEVGRELVNFGGTPAVWNQLSGTETGNYSLVGTVYPGQENTLLRELSTVEASGPMEKGGAKEEAIKWVGTLRGILGRGANGLPVVRAATSQAVLKVKETEEEKEGKKEKAWANPSGLISLVEAPPVAWPKSGTPAYEDATAWISEHLGYENPETHEIKGLGSPEPGEAGGECYRPAKWDVRAEYCNGSEAVVANWDGEYLRQLEKLDCPRNQPGFEKVECEEVVAQLKIEFTYIHYVYGLVAQLKEPFEKNEKLPKEFEDINAKVEVESTKIPAEKEITINPGKAADGALTFASSLASEDPFGAIDGIMDLGFSFSETSSEKPTASPLSAKKEQIGAQAAKRFEGAEEGMGQLTDLLVSDWGKLEKTAANVDGSIWSQTKPAVEALGNETYAGAVKWYYEQVMPAAYEEVQVAPEDGASVEALEKFECAVKRWKGFRSPHTWNPFKKMPASGVFANPAGRFVWAIANTRSEYVEVPTEKLLVNLFSPGGVGVYPAPFFTWGWNEKLNLNALFENEGKPKIFNHTFGSGESCF